MYFLERQLVLGGHRIAFLLGLLVVIACCGCQSGTHGEPVLQPKISFRVVAASYPLHYFTERIVGDRVDVEFPVASGVDPREWNPSIEEIQNLQSADLVIVNGAGAAYAKWLVRVSLSPSKICNSVDELDLGDYFIVNDYQIVHTHGPEGEHSHAYMVPYPWLDPTVAKKQSAKIAKSLSKLYPEFQSEFDVNLKALESDLDALSTEFTSAGLSGTVVTSNPDAKYLVRALGFDDQHLLLFDFEKPTQADAMTRIKSLGDETIKRLIWVGAGDAGADTKMMENFRSLFGTSAPPMVSVDLLDHCPENGDYLSAMRKTLQQFKQ